LHAVFHAGFDGGTEDVQFVLFEEFPDGRGIDQDFDCGNDSALGAFQEALADYTLQVAGDIQADLVPFVGWEELQ